VLTLAELNAVVDARRWVLVNIVGFLLSFFGGVLSPGARAEEGESRVFTTRVVAEKTEYLPCDLSEMQFSSGGKTPVENLLTVGFYVAARFGSLSVLKFHVEKGMNPRSMNSLALCLSAKHGHLAALKYLIEQGANIHDRNDGAIRFALENRHWKVVDSIQNAFYHKYGLNPDDGEAVGFKRGDYEIVKQLLQQDIAVYLYVKDILDRAVCMDYIDILQYVFSRNEIRRERRTELLSRGACCGSLSSILFLLSRGADAHGLVEEAAREGHLDAVKLLLDEDPLDSRVERSFRSASVAGRRKVIAYFLENFDINLLGIEQAFRDAAKYGQQGILTDLLEFGAIDIRQHGEDALVLALTAGHLETALFLMGFDAVDIHKQAERICGLTLGGTKATVVQFMMEQGVYLSSESRKDAFSSAIRYKNLKGLSYLLEEEYQRGIVHSWSESEIAMGARDKEIVKLFKHYGLSQQRVDPYLMLEECSSPPSFGKMQPLIPVTECL